MLVRVSATQVRPHRCVTPLIGFAVQQPLHMRGWVTIEERGLGASVFAGQTEFSVWYAMRDLHPNPLKRIDAFVGLRPHSPKWPLNCAP
jgi:hypothetical protein